MGHSALESASLWVPQLGALSLSPHGREAQGLSLIKEKKPRQSPHCGQHGHTSAWGRPGTTVRVHPEARAVCVRRPHAHST